MQLQPVVMNAFSQSPIQGSLQSQMTANAFDNTANSPLVQLLARAQEICNAQERRVADDLKTHKKGRTTTAKILGLLQLQYDLDDMNFSATLAKNVANQFSQALTTLTQRT
ncbi:MAG TPA: hypothetical protein VL689_12300 [Paraburkholderia sp.]|jgi:hypothetical protein|nr:hypothetical protein [Paraburkholderia sp.]